MSTTIASRRPRAAVAAPRRARPSTASASSSTSSSTSKQAAKSTTPKRAAVKTATLKSPANGVLYPLDFVYQRAGMAPPVVAVVAPDEIPLPYRSLLVHANDMTVTLERHFGGRVVLRPLSTFTIGGWYYRRVLLAQEYSGRPVEMGAIRIRLDAFPAKIRAQIQRNEVPLGRILRDGGVDFKSVAKVFLAITPNLEMMGVFWMREPRTLYGRQTEVMYRGAKIGDIVEVLPLV